MEVYKISAVVVSCLAILVCWYANTSVLATSFGSCLLAAGPETWDCEKRSGVFSA